VLNLLYLLYSALRQGRLNQWAHWARAQGRRVFFIFEGPPTGCGEINFIKLTILLLMLLHDRTNTSCAYLVNLRKTVQQMLLIFCLNLRKDQL